MTDRGKREYSRAELDAMGGRFYERLHQQVPHEPWEAMPDHRRWPWRQGALALIEAKDIIDAHKLREARQGQSRTVRVYQRA